MISLRDRRQSEFAEQFIDKGWWGILNLCPRFGKVRVAINVFNKLPKNALILIAYPDKKIKRSWITDFLLMQYDDVNVHFTTHLSLKKCVNNLYDLVVIDEIHLLSEAQILVCKELFQANRRVLGLTGTLSSWTEKVLREDLNLRVVAKYPIELAIEEGILPDYEITVVSVPLDKKILNKYGKYSFTEKNRFDYLSSKIIRIEGMGQDTKFLRFERMRIIQNSKSKLAKTKELLSLHSGERVLVFTGTTAIADSLDIPSFHSKSTNSEVFTDFAEGKGNHLAVVKIGNTGVTYMPLNRVIINYFDSNSENLTQKINRCLSLEYNNPEKKGMIYIITSNEPTEQNWMKKAISMFDPKKIKYV